MNRWLQHLPVLPIVVPLITGAAMLLLAHCAYHVGEIRQRLLWVNTEAHN